MTPKQEKFIVYSFNRLLQEHKALAVRVTALESHSQSKSDDLPSPLPVSSNDGLVPFRCDGKF